LKVAVRGFFDPAQKLCSNQTVGTVNFPGFKNLEGLCTCVVRLRVGGTEIFSLKKFPCPLPANGRAVEQKKAPDTPLNHIPLLRFRPGGVLQELVARRRGQRYDDAPEKFQQVK
jgi:hypothetical protein